MKDIQTVINLGNRGREGRDVSLWGSENVSPMVAFGCNSSCFTNTNRPNLSLDLLRHPARP